METVEEQLQLCFSSWVEKCKISIDQAIVHYLLSVTTSSMEDDNHDVSDMISEDGITSMHVTESLSSLVKPILIDAGVTEEAVDSLCRQLQQLLSKEREKRAPKRIEKLEKPIQMSVLASDMNVLADQVNRWNLTYADTTTRVDNEKLKKLEERAKRKQERKQQKEREKEAYDLAQKEGSSSDEDQQSLKDATLTPSSTGGNASKDIRLVNFDLLCYGKVMLADTNLTLAYGRRYGLVGRNGIGKSTLLRSLSRRDLPVPDHLSIMHVEQEVVGDDTRAIDSVLRADDVRWRLIEEERQINVLLNDPALSPDARERHSQRLNIIYEQLLLQDAESAQSRAAKILNGLGFRTDQHVWPTRSFSGGWRMRLALARALFAAPDLLLLDEPTNMLDMRAVIWLEKYLQQWPKTMIIVSHDRAFLNAVASDIVHMHHGTLDIYRGDYNSFEETRTKNLLHQQREFESQQMQRAHLQAFVDRWRCNANRASQAQSKLKILEKLPDLKPVEPEAEVKFSFIGSTPLNGTVLQMQDVYFRYPAKEQGHQNPPVLSHIDLSLSMQSRVAIIGPNGAGKTTLIKLLMGQIEASGGYVQRHGKLRLGHFSQHHVDQLDLTKTAVDFLQSKFPGQPGEFYRRQLGGFGLSGTLGLQPMATLSGGQKSRVAFTYLDMQRPHILVLDEPTNHLDIETVDGLARSLNDFKGGILIVSHDERLITSVCNEIWICGDGTMKKHDGLFKDYRRTVERELEK